MLKRLFSWLDKLVEKDLFRREFGFFPSGREPSQAERKTVSEHFSRLLLELKMAEGSVYQVQDDASTGDAESLERYRRRESDFCAAQEHLRRASEYAGRFCFEDQVSGLILCWLETKIQPTRPYEALGSIS